MSPKEDKTHDRKSNPGSGSGGDGQDQGDRGKGIVLPPPPPGSPKDRTPGKSDGDDDDSDDDGLIIIIDPPAPAYVRSAGESGGKQAPGVGGGEEGTSAARGKKRGRPPKAKEPMVVDQGPVVSAEGERPRKRVEFDAPEVPRPCSVCGKNFNNYKALFGHMRSHPGRLWRGAYPPPISRPFLPTQDIREEGEQLAASLLTIGERLILGDPPEGMYDDAGAAGSQPSGGANPRGLEIDLNVDPVLSDPPSPEPENVVEAERKEIDLNKDPSDEGEGW